MDARFAEFVRERHTHLLRRAYLLTGGDQPAAEDLVQEALARGYRAGLRSHIDRLEPYIVRTMANLSVSRGRRTAGRLEVLTADVPEPSRDATSIGGEDRDVLWDVLRELPRQQRAVLVLRFYEDLGERQIADVLGVSVGTVRSHSARGLSRMRAALAMLDASGEPR